MCLGDNDTTFNYSVPIIFICRLIALSSIRTFVRLDSWVLPRYRVKKKSVSVRVKLNKISLHHLDRQCHQKQVSLGAKHLWQGSSSHINFTLQFGQLTKSWFILDLPLFLCCALILLNLAATTGDCNRSFKKACNSALPCIERSANSPLLRAILSISLAPAFSAWSLKRLHHQL